MSMYLGYVLAGIIVNGVKGMSPKFKREVAFYMKEALANNPEKYGDISERTQKILLVVVGIILAVCSAFTVWLPSLICKYLYSFYKDEKCDNDDTPGAVKV